jgi:hypothetical protein
MRLQYAEQLCMMQKKGTEQMYMLEKKGTSLNVAIWNTEGVIR